MKKGFIQEGQDGQNVSVRNAVPLGREKREEVAGSGMMEGYVGSGSVRRKRKIRTL